MKRFLSLLLLLSVTGGQAAAQEKPLRKKYINLSYASQTLSPGEISGIELKSKYGAAFTYGRSYYLHSRPVAGMIRFGVDATFLDMNYAHYSEKWIWDGEDDESRDDGESREEEPYELKLHQAEIGLQVGPSVTVNPVGKLNVHLYFRYAPTFAALYDTEGGDVMGNYASFFVSGGSVSYGAVGLGAEARWGKCKYKVFGGGDDESFSAGKLKTSGVRIYLNFRF